MSDKRTLLVLAVVTLASVGGCKDEATRYEELRTDLTISELGLQYYQTALGTALTDPEYRAIEKAYREARDTAGEATKSRLDAEWSEARRARGLDTLFEQHRAAEAKHFLAKRKFERFSQ